MVSTSLLADSSLSIVNGTPGPWCGIQLWISVSSSISPWLDILTCSEEAGLDIDFKISPQKIYHASALLKLSENSVQQRTNGSNRSGKVNQKGKIEG
ncbi:hypothetical protein STEG23_020244 [Scotinomys teguina]